MVQLCLSFDYVMVSVIRLGKSCSRHTNNTAFFKCQVGSLFSHGDGGDGDIANDLVAMLVSRSDDCLPKLFS